MACQNTQPRVEQDSKIRRKKDNLIKIRQIFILAKSNFSKT